MKGPVSDFHKVHDIFAFNSTEYLERLEKMLEVEQRLYHHCKTCLGISPWAKCTIGGGLDWG